jgi:deoxyribonuclease-4
MTTKKQVLLGAHMSIAGGLEKAVERGESIGCTCIQIFTKSNRQWKAKKLTEAEIETFKTAVKQSTIASKNIVCHAGYLINIASPNTLIHKKSTDSLIEELDRCEKLGIPWLVLHPGAYKEEDVALKTIAQTIDTVLHEVPGKTKILLETMAGQGSTTCYTFEQIAQVHKLVKNKNRVGVCVDTCHIFAAGYDLRTKKVYDETWEHFDKIIGLSLLHVIHCNDSKKGLGSRVDRHADIGKGELGLETFRLLFNDKRLTDIPKILETPQTGDDLLQDYKKNMEVIEKLIR